jgi:hypothetical protein
VHISDIELSYPASLDFLRTYIANSLAISQGHIVVYSENDPRQTEIDTFIARTSKDHKAAYEPFLGSEYAETGDQSLYGDNYNMDFLKTLAQVRKERTVTVADSPFNPDSVPLGDLGSEYHSYLDKKHTPSDNTGLFGRIKPTKPK